MHLLERAKVEIIGLLPVATVAACCAANNDARHSASRAEMRQDEAMPASDAPLNRRQRRTSKGSILDEPPRPRQSARAGKKYAYRVYLEKKGGAKLGLDIDFVRERSVLPITGVTGGVAKAWNLLHPDTSLQPGDSIIDVNGTRGDVAAMLERCKTDTVLELTLKRGLNYEQLVADLEDLIQSKECGPILIRLSWQDAGVYTEGGDKESGCPNAVMRFVDEGEASFSANAGLPTVALGLLAPIAEKYCPDLISNADLWALAANVAIRVMGGPDIPTHFGREDACSANEGVDTQHGRLPDGAGGPAHLRTIFNSKGFQDKEIVALSGAHTVGRCHRDRSGYDGAWTEDPLVFNNSYFVEMLVKTYSPESTGSGVLQLRSRSGTIMLPSDIALLQSPTFKRYVELYASDQDLFFAEFADCWVRLQEKGCKYLRDVL